MRSSGVYEPIYTVNNLYSYIICILQDIFLRQNYVFFLTWNLVLFTSYSSLP